MELVDQSKFNQARKLIILLSIVIPVVVAVLFKVKIEFEGLEFLPGVYASINALTAVFLIYAKIAIRRDKLELHRTLIRIALLLSLLFLALYVAYHMTSDSTVFGDSNGDGSLDILERQNTGLMVYFYYPILISHIVLSVAVIPLVLFSYLYAWQGDFVKHKKWNRFAYPIWLYVAISGVVVYLMISPFYN